MKNAKFNIICASCGFLLSLVVGIITRASFGVLLLRAFIFALVFAAVSFGLQIVFKTVLSTEEQGDSLTQSEDGAKAGSVVNITLQEEELPMENNAQRFFVGENHQMLNEDDYGHSLNETADTQVASAQHVDMVMDDADEETDADSPRSASGENASSEDVAQQSPSQQTGFTAAPLQNVAQSSAVSDGGLASLPDISGLGGDSESSAPEVVAPEPVSAPRSTSASSISAKVNVSDAALMAKAISTALASDSD